MNLEDIQIELIPHNKELASPSLDSFMYDWPISINLKPPIFNTITKRAMFRT